jgi:hypothetical protein
MISGAGRQQHQSGQLSATSPDPAGFAARAARPHLIVGETAQRQLEHFPAPRRVDDLPRAHEEMYYFRVSPADGFGICHYYNEGRGLPCVTAASMTPRLPHIVSRRDTPITCGSWQATSAYRVRWKIRS